jgi:murein L,D-transpeptidase YafK
VSWISDSLKLKAWKVLKNTDKNIYILSTNEDKYVMCGRPKHFSFSFSKQKQTKKFHACGAPVEGGQKNFLTLLEIFLGSL